MTEFILYGRPDCHLCEAMAAALAAILPAGSYRLRTVDVDSDPETERRYGARIPVLVLDGEEVCHYVLDPAQLARHLA